MFLPDPTPDNRVETRFEARGDGTSMTMTMTLPDEKTRAAMLSTGMAQGMEASYARFETEVTGSAGDGRYFVVDVEPRLTAAVKFEAAFSDLPNSERAARTKLAEALPALGVTAGLASTFCRLLDGGKMHYEPGVIVDRTFAASGDVACSELPGGRVVKHTLIGSFDQLPHAWAALFAWCEENDLKREGSFWQVYGPAPSDPAEQETILYALLS